MQARLKVMTPLLGMKTPSAPVGDKSVEDRRAARSLLSRALWRAMGRLWRGMGGMGRPEQLFVRPPHQQQGLSGFHETRDTRHESRLLCFPTHHFPLFPTISRHFPAPPPPSADQVSTRRPPFLVSRPDCRAAPPGHCFPARCGAAMARHERHIAPEPVSARRQPQLPPPSGFVPLRRTPNETMLRKGNILL